MRLFIALFALFGLLVALASAAPIDPATDYVSIANPGYKDYYKKYTASKAGACINVDKAFNKPNTFTFTHGRSVELYAGPNCSNKFHTTKTNKSPVLKIHAIRSFK
ncbi:hypothetical protein GGF44_001901, partial [Coemansia sp. RSA 1694]